MHRPHVLVREIGIYWKAASGFMYLIASLNPKELVRDLWTHAKHRATLIARQIYVLAAHLGHGKSRIRIYAPDCTRRSEDVCLGSVNGGRAAGGPA